MSFLGNYDQTMYIFGALSIFGLMLSQCLIPGELNQTASEEEIAELELLEANAKDAGEVEKNKNKIGWGTVLTNRYAMFALLCIYWGTYNIIYGEAIFEKYFLKMGDENLLGTAFLI